MIEAYKKMWTNFAKFDGRSSRSDFWWAYLANIIVSFVIGFITGFIAGVTGVSAISYVGYLYSLAIIIPSLALEIRRLHDINKSGWFILLSLIPCVGTFVLLFFLAQPTVENGNQYGQQV